VLAKKNEPGTFFGSKGLVMTILVWVIGVTGLISLAFIANALQNNSVTRQRQRLEEEEKKSDKVDLRISALIAQHMKTLARKHSQIFSIDDYGNRTGQDEWLKEVQYFIDNVVRTDDLFVQELLLAQRQIGKPVIIATSVVAREIDEQIKESGITSDAEDVELITGPEFEVYCAQKLEQGGWSVLRKGGTGDQGVDLVATRGHIRAAIQCKRYSRPVGNKAVQEVAAGRQFEQCDLAVVVSNADYTPAARQLANSLGVLLIHHSELATLNNRVQVDFPH
jgi:restriction system protein